MAMLEFTRAGQSANRGRWGRGEPSAGNRKYEIGIVEVMGLQMILTGLVGLVAGGGRVSWRLGVPGATIGVISSPSGRLPPAGRPRPPSVRGARPSAHEGGCAR